MRVCGHVRKRVGIFTAIQQRYCIGVQRNSIQMIASKNHQPLRKTLMEYFFELFSFFIILGKIETQALIFANKNKITPSPIGKRSSLILQVH